MHLDLGARYLTQMAFQPVEFLLYVGLRSVVEFQVPCLNLDLHPITSLPGVLVAGGPGDTGHHEPQLFVLILCLAQGRINLGGLVTLRAGGVEYFKPHQRRGAR